MFRVCSPAAPPQKFDTMAEAMVEASVLPNAYIEQKTSRGWERVG